MEGPFLRAQHYSEEAEKLRKLAASEEDNENRKTLIEMAESYERLAKRMLTEGMAATKDQSGNILVANKTASE